MCEFVGRVPVFTITSRSAIGVVNDSKPIFFIHFSAISFIGQSYWIFVLFFVYFFKGLSGHEVVGGWQLMKTGVSKKSFGVLAGEPSLHHYAASFAL